MTLHVRIVNLAGSPHLPNYAVKVLLNWDSYAPHQQAELVRHFEARVAAGANVAYEPVEQAPPAPASLVDTIRQRAGLPPVEPAPVHKLDVRRTPTAPTVAAGVPDPPSLIDAIAANRADALKHRRTRR